jgi:hypothetical protein
MTKHKKESEDNEKQFRTNNHSYIIVGLLVAILVMTIFQSYQIAALRENQITETVAGSVTSSAKLSSVIPTGIPETYGSELAVNFDDVSATNPRGADETIQKMAVLDNQIEVTGDDLDRYISIASQISCEYCCGARSVITTDGRAACGCAHSYAMRGLAKYLITEHGDEYTDDQILEELGKWKTLFFPSQMTQKAKVLQEQGIELNYINLASNKYTGIEQGSGGGMVGGC